MTRSLASALGILLCLPLIASAQFGMRDESSALIISASPAYPKAGEDVTLTLTSPVHELEQANIVWTVDGDIVRQGEGVTRINIAAGANNTSKTVEVSIDDATAYTKIVIAPTTVDLLWDTDSYVPPFYLGRSLPSTGTSLRLLAIPHFFAGGKMVPNDQIRFTWKRNDGILRDVSGRNKASITIPSSVLFNADTISVTAETVDGTIVGSATVRIPSVSPLLTLYEDHPVFGIEYYRAINASTNAPSSETTFLAEPFFAPVKSARAPSLIYEWRVNDASAPTDTTRPNELTIDATDSDGVAMVELILQHASNFFLSAEGRWLIKFTSGSIGVGGDTKTANPFSGQ